jgi:hypothetical protein
MEMIVFWIVAPCSLAEKFTDVSEVLTASIIRAMMGDRPDDGGSKHLRNFGELLIK